MNTTTLRWTVAIALLLGTPVSLWAHPGHEADFAQGLMHPWSGWDHLAAMIFIGMLAVRFVSSGGMMWIPGAFIGSMMFGAMGAKLGVWIPGAEWAVSISVIVIGLAAALSGWMSLRGSLILAIFAGLFHGYIHLADNPSAGADYLLGMIAGSAMLHALGLAAGLGIAANTSSVPHDAAVIAVQCRFSGKE